MRRIRYGALLLTMWLAVVPRIPAQEAAAAALVVDGREYRQVAETDQLRLLIEEETATFVVEDRRSGRLWTSFVPQSEDAYRNTNRVWRRNMTSLFIFSIVNLRDELATRRNVNMLTPEHTIETVSVPGGVRFVVWFPGYRLGVSVIVAIEDDALEIRIPEESIIEETDLVFVSISLLPFFGYAKPTDSGYIVVPDGSGALYHYKPTQSKAMANEKRVSWYVYAPEEVDFERYFEIEDDMLKTAYLPVFGVKKGDDAFVASIDEGDTDAYIHFNEYGFAVELNRIYAEFTVRHAYELFLSEISVEGSLPSRDIVPTRYDRDRIPIDRAVRYQFLTGENATYSGMARAYRNHLRSTGVLTSTLSAGEIPLGLSLFGGIFEERLLFDKFVPMTSFTDAARIIDALLDRDVSSIRANLIGWSRKGYERFPIRWPPDRRLGGRRGLRRLADEVSGNAVKLYVQIDPVHAILGNGRFNRRNDVVKQRTNLAGGAKLAGMFLLNPEEAYFRVSEVADKLRRFGIDGITFEAIGDILFHDYNGRAPSQRNETLDTWKAMTELSNEALGASALVRGNIRQADAVDLIFELPMETSGYMVIDEMIPFYQMVLHGSVYYTTDPENLFYDTQRQFLLWIETGAIPYYVLTRERSERLAYTDYNHLFTSYFEDWIDVAAERYHEFNTEFGDFYYLDMVDHKRLSDDVVQVTFGDGSRIILNYGDEPIVVDGITVGGVDYRVVRGGAPVAGSTQ